MVDMGDNAKISYIFLIIHSFLSLHILIHNTFYSKSLCFSTKFCSLSIRQIRFPSMAAHCRSTWANAIVPIIKSIKIIIDFAKVFIMSMLLLFFPPFRLCPLPSFYPLRADARTSPKISAQRRTSLILLRLFPISIRADFPESS